MLNELNINFAAAKSDIQDCFDNPVKESDRLTRDWIYSVDPETMIFVKAVFKAMPGHYSLYDTFVSIMKKSSLESVLKNK